MKDSMRSKLASLALRMEEIDATLADPQVASDPDKLRALTCERAEIEPVTRLFADYTAAEARIAEAKELLGDPDMKELAAEEIEQAKDECEALEKRLSCELIPKDPNDAKNIYLEIRAGTGGEESALFSADLLRMYLRYVERTGWKSEMISATESDLGGYKEVIVRVIGSGAYSRLKYESGGHRVQRVPVTEAQGRIHTSACTVAVLPELDPIKDVQINPADLRIDVYRSSGAGGQHVQKTESAVRITHIPTGIVVECQDERSQHENKARALGVLASRIHAAQVAEQQAAEAATRKGLVGTGDRSDRIRTYNFPQGRCTDHRINLTLYRLDSIMDGDIDEILQALAAEDQAEKLAALGEGL